MLVPWHRCVPQRLALHSRHRLPVRPCFDLARQERCERLNRDIERQKYEVRNAAHEQEPASLSKQSSCARPRQLLKLIRVFLSTGVMENGLVSSGLKRDRTTFNRVGSHRQLLEVFDSRTRTSAQSVRASRPNCACRCGRQATLIHYISFAGNFVTTFRRIGVERSSRRLEPKLLLPRVGLSAASSRNHCPRSPTPK